MAGWWRSNGPSTDDERLHTITPKRYVDTRYDGGGPFPPQGATGEFFIFDFGAPDYLDGRRRQRGARERLGDRLQPHRHRRQVRRAPTRLPRQLSGAPAGLERQLGDGQTVANFATVAAASSTGFAASVAFHNASAGNVHAIVDIFGYFA